MGGSSRTVGERREWPSHDLVDERTVSAAVRALCDDHDLVAPRHLQVQVAKERLDAASGRPRLAADVREAQLQTGGSSRYGRISSSRGWAHDRR